MSRRGNNSSQRAFWSANREFAGIVKGTNTLIRVRHAAQNWKDGLPSGVESQLNSVFAGIRLPCPTPWLKNGLDQLRKDMMTQLQQHVLHHLSDTSRDVLSSVNQLDQTDADVAHQVAVRQLRRTHGRRIKDNTISTVLSDIAPRQLPAQQSTELQQPVVSMPPPITTTSEPVTQQPTRLTKTARRLTSRKEIAMETQSTPSTSGLVPTTITQSSTQSTSASTTTSTTTVQSTSTMSTTHQQIHPFETLAAVVQLPTEYGQALDRLRYIVRRHPSFTRDEKDKLRQTIEMLYSNHQCYLEDHTYKQPWATYRETGRFTPDEESHLMDLLRRLTEHIEQH
jgi:hypothetical protein